MNAIEDVEAIRSFCRAAERPLGFVPTMGALHDGHLSLVRAARGGDRTVLASVFVNPTQFGPGEDYQRYPRDLARDLGALDAAGVDAVFAPDAAAMYAADHDTWVDIPCLTGRLEGASRPGHFRGVLTIVLKLLHIVGPDRLYVGQKDAQQAILIRRMLEDLDVPTRLEVCPTVREPDGVAMSSRNRYLEGEERAAATVLNRALRHAESLWSAGIRDGGALRRAMRATLDEEPLAEPVYVSVADPATLDELEAIEGRALASLAVRIGAARLIDNTLLGGGRL
jgi:pantoate--beta-alanine ligase